MQYIKLSIRIFDVTFIRFYWDNITFDKSFLYLPYRTTYGTVHDVCS